MRALAEQSAKRIAQPGIAQALVVLVLVMPSLFAFLASLGFDSSWATTPGLWFFYKVSLNIGYGAILVALGLTALAVYGRESARSTLVMAALNVAGIVLTWYAGRL